MKITFIGATCEVTGSCTYIEIANKHFLVDYGMRQGKITYDYVSLPVKPAQLDGVFLTHAHIDHSGMLPKLYKEGFRGPIYATDATENLCNILLKDSAHIQETEAEWKNRKNTRSAHLLVEPEYTMDDAIAVMKQFVGYRYGEKIELSSEISFRFGDIGHLLGSSFIELWLTENGVTKKIVFSGDVGNTDHPIICDPKPCDGCDYLVIESTYGNRLHKETVTKNPLEELAGYFQRAFDRGGSVVIPSFAVGRTQEILYIIKGIKEKGLVKGHDHFPVYLDSPLAVEATNVFNSCDHSYFDEKMLALIARGINPLLNDDLKFSITSEDSKMINFIDTPKVIISSSGMCDAGRIRHHLKHNLWNSANIVLFVGYQAEGSLGRLILDGKERVKLFGEEVAVRAEICTMHGTSGHADMNGLIDWINQMTDKPERIFVNHGAEQSCKDFSETLNSLGYNAVCPYSGSEFDLVTKDLKSNEPKLYEKPVSVGASRHEQLHGELLKQANNLLTLAKSLKGTQNRDLIKLTDQIKQLLSRWR